MFECLILGDSTGVGTATALVAQYAIRCDVIAAERATAAQILAWRKPAKRYGASILAIGSNDSPGAKLADNLFKIRTSITTRRAIWLLPYSRQVASLVNKVAVAFGDESIDLGRFATNDHIHPQHYGDVARALLK
ncbi:hypothetical protein CVN68_22325 (plasmid) [Sphingomonas psychrotolerans]|uniref:SGNH/GDSL hydrolase family protein n=2 Tax=Sphingomonas psychrotolerans TaxID=1327635 RepID=A0A2K8MM66_9SPHN|nr:hypothetical protein CVN68_22325 [Sphingomonas psychrotolerans]